MTLSETLQSGGTQGRGLDAIVLNGKVTDGEIWPAEYEAVAIHDGRIVGLGSTTEIARLAGRETRVVDAEGRRVIPGLIDGHLHVVRAGLSYDLAVNWASIRSLDEGLRRLETAAETLPPDAWLYVPGGWTEDQVSEHRGPTTTELDASVADRPAYVQCAYAYAVLNTKAMELIGLKRGKSDLTQDEIEIHPDTGEATGRIFGRSAYSKILDGTIGAPTLEQQTRGTQSFLTELRRLGLTGAIDAAGFRTRPESYDAVNALALSGALDFRLRLYVHPGEPGEQVEQTRQWVRHAQPRSGHPFLQIVGLGEVVHHECHDMSGYNTNFRIGPQEQKELAEISQLAADYGFAMHAHAILDESVGSTLDAWESIDNPQDIGRLRFSIAHGERAKEANLRRVARLGAGIGIQSRMFDTGMGAESAWGPGSFIEAPRIAMMEELGIPLGGGTDGAVGHTYNPWEALAWFVTGSAVGPVPNRAPEHRLSRARALEIYTRGSAWFSFEEHERGGIRPGDLADLTILKDDYFTVDEDLITTIEAWSTIVDGRVVYGHGA